MKFVLLHLALIAGFGFRIGGCDHQAIAQEPRANLYRCEGCEAIYEHPFDNLTWSTTIAGDDEPGERLVLTGTVYETDGTTPAPGVVVYAYHTNAEGNYATRGNETGWGRRHGYLRGWVETDERGRYRFVTITPAPYPEGRNPAHIHMTVKEPDRQEYWIDEVVFEGHSFVDASYRDSGRGGSGVIKLRRADDGTWHGTRDIVLERHPE